MKADGIDSSVGADGRRERISQLVDANGRASVAQLSQLLSVSEATVRKDLAALETEGRLFRTHGGATAGRAQGAGMRSRSELAFEVRERLQVAEKAAIGRAAAELVKDGDSIALDASTTALHVARNLTTRKELTVLTNGIRIAAELAGLPGITVLMPGGVLRWEAFSLVGEWGDVILGRVHIQTAFVGAVGFTLDQGLTDVNAGEAEFKRLLVEAARQVVAVIDHSKWDRVAFTTFCLADRLELVITDPGAPAPMVESVRARGVEVRIVELSDPLG
jgi:DeoR family transcriptional regulator of aga operon/DeoR family fructose operon transcriptional repressor